MAKSRPGHGRPGQLADSQANPLQGPQVRHSGGPDSQRSGKLDSDALSQRMTQFILRIVNPVGQNRVAESVESMGRDLLRKLSALSKGQAISAGAAVNTSVLCRVFFHIVDQAVLRRVDFVLLAGDLFEKRTGDPLAMRVVVEGFPIP